MMYLSLSKKLFISTALASMLMFVGCSSSDGDSSSVGTGDTSGTLSGKVVDGYIANGDVFADINGDGLNNSGDIVSVTDGFGDIVSPADPIPFNTYVYVTGGTDLATGRAFAGRMSAYYTGDSLIVSPLTTMVAALVKTGKTPAAATTSVAAALGVTEAQVSADPVQDPAVFFASQRVVAAIEIFSTHTDGNVSETSFETAITALADNGMDFNATAADLSVPVEAVAQVTAVDALIQEIQVVVEDAITSGDTPDLESYQNVVASTMDDVTEQIILDPVATVTLPTVNNVQLLYDATACITFDKIKGTNTLQTLITADLALSGADSCLQQTDGNVTLAWETDTPLAMSAAGVIQSGIYAPVNVTMTVTITTDNADAETVQKSFALSLPRLDNRAPVANAVTASVDEDGEVLIDIDASDADGDVLSIAISTPPANGVAVVEGGQVKYTPAPNYNGSDVISYTVTDDWSTPATSAPATITVTVNPVDDAPVLAPIADVTRDEDSGIVNIDLNATDIDGDLITYEVNSSNSVVVTASETGSVLTLVPQLNAFGTATITVKATANGVDAIQAFTFTLLPVNDAPTIDPIADPAAVDEDTLPFSVPVTVTDPDSTPTVSVSSGDTSVVTVAMNAGSVVITPVAEASGSSLITVTADDAVNAPISVTFTVTVNPVDDAPVLADLAPVTVDEDNGAYTVTATATDIDNDDAAIVYALASSSDTSIATVSGMDVTPVTDASGSVDINVTATSNGVTVSKVLVFTINPVDDAPVLSPLANIVVDEDSGATTITPSATDVDNNDSAITYSMVSSNPSVVSISGLDIVTEANASGVATITVTATSNTLTDSQEFNVTVNPVNDAPVANNFTVSILTGSSGNVIDVASHITDPDVGDTHTITAFDPTSGLSTTGATEFTYDSNGTEGSIVVNYTIQDATGLSSSAVMTLIVSTTPIYPVANDDAATTDEEVAVNIDVLANDINVSTVVTAWLATPANGTVVPEANNTITFTPALNVAGQVVIFYTAASSTGHEANATVTVTINDINDAPVVEYLTSVPLYMTEATTEQVVRVDLNISDVDTDLASVLIIGANSDNSAVFVQGYSPTYVDVSVPAYANGDANVTFTVSDGQDTTVETFQVYVAAVDSTPYITTTETWIDLNNSSATYSLSVAPSNESFTLSLTDSGNAGIAVVSLNADGVTLDITPIAAGSTIVTVHAVNDANGSLFSDTNITVNIFDSSNVAPVAYDATVSIVSGQVQSGALQATDDSGSMTFTIVDQPLYGDIVEFDASTGAITYAATNAYIGQDILTFQVTDNGGLTSNTATVTIDVTASPDAGSDNNSLTEQAITLSEYNALAAQTATDGLVMYSVWENGWDTSNLETERLTFSTSPQEIEILHVEQNMTEILPYTLGADSVTMLLDFDGNGSTDFEVKYLGTATQIDLETEMNLTLPAGAAGYQLATLQVTEEYNVWDEPEYRDWNCTVQPCVGSNPYSTLDEYMLDKTYDPNTPSWSAIWVNGYNFRFAEGSSLADGNGTIIQSTVYWGSSGETEYITIADAGKWELVNVNGTDYIKVTPTVYGLESVAIYSVGSDSLVHGGEYNPANTAKLEYHFDETTVHYIGNSIMNRTIESLPSQPLSSAVGEFISFNTLATAPLVQNEWMKAIWAYDDGMNGYTINTHGLYFDTNGSLYMTDTQDGDSNMTYQVSNDIITIDGAGIEGKVAEVITSAAELSVITGIPEGALPASPVAYRFAYLSPTAELDLWGDTVNDLTGSVTYSTFADFQTAFISGQVAVEYTPNGGIGFASGVAGVGGTLAEYAFDTTVVTENAGTWEIIDFEGQPIMLITVTVPRYGDHNAIAFDGGISLVGRGRYSPPDSGSVELRYNPETTTAIINYLQDQNTTYGNPITYEKEIKILRNVQAVPFTNDKMYMADVVADASTNCDRNVSTFYIWMNGTLGVGSSGDFVMSDDPGVYTYASVDGQVATITDTASASEFFKVKVNEELNASVLRTETSLYLPDSAHGYRITYMDIATGTGGTEIKLDAATVLFLESYYWNNPNVACTGTSVLP